MGRDGGEIAKCRIPYTYWRFLKRGFGSFLSSLLLIPIFSSSCRDTDIYFLYPTNIPKWPPTLPLLAVPLASDTKVPQLARLRRSVVVSVPFISPGYPQAIPRLEARTNKISRHLHRLPQEQQDPGEGRYLPHRYLRYLQQQPASRR